MASQQLDDGVVGKLRGMGGDSLVRRMVRLFLVTSDEARLRISGALANHTLAVAQTAAHHLFSSAAQLKLVEVAEHARAVEAAARAGDETRADAALQELTPALARASQALRQLLAELPQAARVAVIDDSEDVRVLLRLVLESQFDVVEYASATAALLEMRRFPPDVALIDVTLPDMSGIDLLEFMRADPRLCSIPAIALTALSSNHDQPFESAGFALHVRKPVLDTDALISALNTLLEKHSS